MKVMKSTEGKFPIKADILCISDNYIRQISSCAIIKQYQLS